MRCAVYDIGSNSVKFLVAEVRPGRPPEILAEKSKTTRLAEDLIVRGELKEEAIERTLEALAKLRGKADKLGAAPENSRAVATSAVRDSGNRKRFLKAAAEVLGHPILLLSGEEEADGIYRGICSDPNLPSRRLMGIDVGGGSAEWVLGGDSGVLRRTSLPLGTVRLRERFLPEYPVPRQGLQLMRQTLLQQLEPVLAKYALEGREVVGTGGTLNVAAALDLGLKEYDASRIHGHRLTRERLEALVDFLAARDLETLQALPAMPQGRADIVLPGAAVFAASLRLLGAPHVTVSTRGLRYGVLEQLREDLGT
ncbi:MAG: Ppx/GppA phosphatase family protein [Verrucomicrobium sp.]|nr:Ppx/GppA phosphatase family protein [Verrucomicrobium sp.]